MSVSRINSKDIVANTRSVIGKDKVIDLKELFYQNICLSSDPV